MTRKTALMIALESTKDVQARDVIKRLIKSMPLHEWDKDTIIDAVEQFKIDTARYPTASDFKYSGVLPQGATVQYRFGFPLSEFIKRYCSSDVKCDSRVYYTKTKEEWLAFFIDVFNKIHPISACDFNKRRPIGSPTWYFYGKLFGLTKWNELLKAAKVSCKRIPKIKEREKIKLSVASHYEL